MLGLLHAFPFLFLREILLFSDLDTMHLGSRHHEVRERKIQMMENKYNQLAAMGIEARSRKRIDSTAREKSVKMSYALARQRVRKKIEDERKRKKEEAEKERERAQNSYGSKLQDECKYLWQS